MMKPSEMNEHQLNAYGVGRRSVLDSESMRALEESDLYVEGVIGTDEYVVLKNRWGQFPLVLAGTDLRPFILKQASARAVSASNYGYLQVTLGWSDARHYQGRRNAPGRDWPDSIDEFLALAGCPRG
jgi:hypothetical protein